MYYPVIYPSNLFTGQYLELNVPTVIVHLNVDVDFHVIIMLKYLTVPKPPLPINEDFLTLDTLPAGSRVYIRYSTIFIYFC